MERRKLTARDWLALAIPAMLIAVATVFLSRDRGWIGGTFWFVTATAFVLWRWLKRIRDKPQDTWRY